MSTSVMLYAFRAKQYVYIDKLDYLGYERNHLSITPPGDSQMIWIQHLTAVMRRWPDYHSDEPDRVRLMQYVGWTEVACRFIDAFPGDTFFYVDDNEQWNHGVDRFKYYEQWRGGDIE